MSMGQLMPMLAGSGGDTYFNSVALLLHFEGANNGVIFTDSSSFGRVLNNGNANMVTTNTFPKFGLTCGHSTGGHFSVATGSEVGLGAGDFTVEMWVRASGVATGSLIDFRFYGGSNHPSITLFNGAINWLVNGVSRISGGSVISLNVWYHVAVSRVSGQSRMFVDGVQVGSTYSDSTNFTAQQDRPIMFANAIGGDVFNGGRIDDLRITVGAGRYISNFTPPTQPFPNF